MKKGFKHKPQNLDCPYCSRGGLTNEQAVIGHILVVHGRDALDRYQASKQGEAEETGQPAIALETGNTPAPSPSLVRAKKAEVELLELERKRNTLLRELGTNDPKRFPSITEQLGYGEIRPNIAEQIQQKLLLGQSQSQQGFWDLLTSPNLPTIIQGLKGILGTGGNNAGGLTDTLALLQSLGINLKELLTQNQAQKAGALRIGDIDLSGAVLTPQVLSAIIGYKSEEKKAELEKDGRDRMADALENAMRWIGEGIGKGAFSGEGVPGASGVSQREPEQTFITCGECGVQTLVDPNTKPGDRIECSNPDCGVSWIASEKTEPVKSRPVRRRKARVLPEPDKNMLCSECGTLLNTTGYEVGARIKCPACDTEQIITSESEPLPAIEPEPREEG